MTGFRDSRVFPSEYGKNSRNSASVRPEAMRQEKIPCQQGNTGAQIHDLKGISGI
jgi:hypothetical protein